MDKTRRNKVRNYSFKESKRLPEDKMTDVNGVRVPSMPGSCYHAIICALASNKNNLVHWDKVVELTERFMRQYGGTTAWEKFRGKSDVKTYEKRIKDNTHTLTRTGKDCYGYRLHERGMAIYFFKDGAMLLTGGKFVETDGDYDVTFPDGRGLQVRYRGTTMTSREYKKFLEMGYIDKNGKIINPESIRRYRLNRTREIPSLEISEHSNVRVVLAPNYDQHTAFRLEQLGLIVEGVENENLLGKIPTDKLDDLRSDQDVVSVEVS